MKSSMSHHAGCACCSGYVKAFAASMLMSLARCRSVACSLPWPPLVPQHCGLSSRCSVLLWTDTACKFAASQWWVASTKAATPSLHVLVALQISTRQSRHVKLLQPCTGRISTGWLRAWTGEQLFLIFTSQCAKNKPCNSLLCIALHDASQVL